MSRRKNGTGTLQQSHGAWFLYYYDRKPDGGWHKKCVRVADAAAPREEVERSAAHILAAPKRFRDNLKQTVVRIDLEKSGKDYFLVRKKETLLQQNGRCVICKADSPGNKKTGWHFDHDHVTGIYRGVLCSRCNVILGWVQDDDNLLLEMALYLRAHRRTSVVA